MNTMRKINVVNFFFLVVAACNSANSHIINVVKYRAHPKIRRPKPYHLTFVFLVALDGFHPLQTRYPFRTELFHAQMHGEKFYRTIALAVGKPLLFGFV